MAAGGIPGSVKLGPGRIWVTNYVGGGADPTTNSAALPSAWLPVGYTEAGSAFQSNTTSESVFVAEELDEILRVSTQRTNQIVFEMAEATVDKLSIALNAGTEDDPESVTSFEPPDLGAELYVKLVWDSDETASAANRRWLFRKVSQVGNLEIARRKAPTKTLIPVTFAILRPDNGDKPWKAFPNTDGEI